jgi:DNA-binding MarR family transcriptional regulator
MKDLAERLDVGADVASKLVSSLEERGYARRNRSSDDRRAINVAATAAAQRRLAEIDVRVREDISLLQRDWPRAMQLAALETFAFYAGLAVDPDVLAGIEAQRISLNPPWK